jgi:hypothetical protein
MSKQRKSVKSVHPVSKLELVVALLAGFIFLFGVAGFMATDGVQLGFKLLQNPKSMAAIAAEDGLFTDDGIVSFSKIRGIIDNLQLFSTVAVVFGGVVCSAFSYRIWSKTRIVYK